MTRSLPSLPRPGAVFARWAVVAWGACALAVPAGAEIGLFISGGGFQDEEGVALPQDGLLQLILLGLDEMLNPVIEGAWTSGDDLVIDFDFGSSEYASSGGFDLFEGVPDPENPTGFEDLLFRQLNLQAPAGALPEGAAFALRWWPGMTAADYHDGALPAVGQAYGQARVDFTSSGYAAWLIPAESALNTELYPLISDEYAALTSLPATPGFNPVADLKVLPETVIPEPGALGAWVGLGLLAGVATRRRVCAGGCRAGA